MSEKVDHRRQLERPAWAPFFFGLAVTYARRSRDPRTRHGCIIVDPRNDVPVGFGYNSFLAKMPDDLLPTEAPAKYPHMDHAEVNATGSLRIDPWSVPGGLIAYITGQPCYACARDLVRHNVLTWHVADRPGHTDASRDMKEATDLVIEHRKVSVHVHKPNLSWLADEVWHSELRSLGFMPASQGEQGVSEETADDWLTGRLLEYLPALNWVRSNVAPYRRHIWTPYGSFEVDTSRKVGLLTSCSSDFDLTDEKEWVTMLACLVPDDMTKPKNPEPRTE